MDDGRGNPRGIRQGTAEKLIGSWIKTVKSIDEEIEITYPSVNHSKRETNRIKKPKNDEIKRLVNRVFAEDDWQVKTIKG